MKYCCAKVPKEGRAFYNRFKQLCARKDDVKDSEYYRFGYETFGIILYGFCKWLIEDLKKRKISRVLFCSRDGYIIKEAFSTIPGNVDFDTDYIYVSRRSLRVPLLHLNTENKSKAIFATRYISIFDLLDSIGLNPNNYKEIVERNQLTLQTVIQDKAIDQDKRVINLFDELWEDVVSNSEYEYSNAQKYIQGLELSGDVAIIDIGWRGSIQYYLQQMLKSLGNNTELKGYYITLSSSMLHGQRMKGYLQNVDDGSSGCDLLRGYVGLIEMMFLKTEGSTKCYGEDGCPIFESYEYSENGNYTHEVEAVLCIQKGALDCVRDLVKENISEPFSSEVAFANLSRVGNHPSKKNLELFEDFRFFNNGTISYLTGEYTLKYNLCHFKDMKRDFYGSRWRIGFMKKNFKIPFPYHLLFKLIMKVKL